MLSQKTRPPSDESGRALHDLIPGPTPSPNVVARLAALVRSGTLDRALIAGANPANSPQLAARAARLTAPRSRRSIADGLQRLLQAGHGPSRRWSAVSRGDHLLANATALRDLAALLRGGSPLYARGIAILEQLLSDGTGPAYHGTSDELARRLGEARTAMSD